MQDDPQPKLVSAPPALLADPPAPGSSSAPPLSSPQSIAPQKSPVIELAPARGGTQPSGSKSQPTETIMKIVVGGTDPFGYRITEVITRANEYAIYEVDRPELSETLRVILDGYGDASEKTLLERFEKVSEKYNEAKGVAYRSPNYGLMRHRVAAVLSAVLSSDQSAQEGNQEFARLIKTLKQEDLARIEHRAYYLFPAIFATAVWVVVAAAAMPLRLSTRLDYWQLVTAVLASLLGGSMSILISVRKLNFEEYASTRFYLMLGAERVFLALVSGAIAFTLLKSGFILPAIKGESYWAMMTILIAAAFSESMIPGALQKIEAGTRVAERTEKK